MTAQAPLHAAKSATSASAIRAQARRSAPACWVAVLTLLAALLGAGVCMTAGLPQVSPGLAQVQ